MSRGVRFLGMPIRRINGWLNHWRFDQLLLDKTFGLRQLFRASLKFDASTKRFSSSADGAGEVYQWPSGKTLANPLWWFVWTCQFAWRWLVTRPFLAMAAALPGIALAVGFFGAVAAGGRINRSTEAMRYRASFLSATEQGDYETARKVGRTLIRINPRSNQDIYNQALVADKLDDDASAKTLMAYAARDLGSEPASLWLAQRCGDRSQLHSWPAETRREYEQWLGIALKANPANAQARKALADSLRLKGDLPGAYQTLLPLARTDADANYLVIILEKEMGLAEQARERAKSALESKEQILADVPQELNMRLQLASLLVFLGREEEAVQRLKEGLEYPASAEQTMKLRRALADGMVLLSNKTASSDKSPRGVMKRFEQLRMAVDYDPNSRAVIDAVTEACADVAASDNRELLVLREAIVQGISPDASHFILGTLALNEGRVETAMQHLEIAAEQNPNLPGLLNNLAYAICQQKEADLQRALRLVEAAISADPNNAYCRETRGQILLRLGRWQAAISDLEFALKESSLRQLVRPGLAAAYDQLGQPELAKRHRQLAKKGI